MIGAVVKARGRATLRIVGADAGAWIGEPVEFGSPRRLSAADMAAYGLAPPPNLDPDTALAAADAQRTRDANEAYFRGRAAKRPRVVPRAPGFTPEDAFEAAAADTPSAAREMAARILADPAKLALVDRGEVGIHAAVARELERMRDAEQ